MRIMRQLSCGKMSKRLYIVKTEEYYKIGVSREPNKRLSHIRTESPFYCELVTTVKAKNGSAKRLEKLLHENYAKYRKSGEWFDLDNQEVASYIMIDEIDVQKVKETVHENLSANGGVDRLVITVKQANK